MTEAVSLKSLRDRPFELLAELERRGRALSAQVAGNIAKLASMFIASSASFLFLHYLVFNKKDH